jgi:hypothetical protein
MLTICIRSLLVSGVYGSGNGKPTQEGEVDESTSPMQPSTPVEQIKTPIFVDEPLFNEQWYVTTIEYFRYI